MPIKRRRSEATENVVTGGKKRTCSSNITESKIVNNLSHPRTQQWQYRSRKNDVKHKWSCFKSQAKHRGIDQQLTLEQYATLIALPCTYCGYGSAHTSTDLIGVDRIDSSRREYTLSNCVPCCSTCNFMKGRLDHNDFLAQVRAIARWRT